MIQIEIDKGSGFCFGVTTAINKAEEELANDRTLYCLGDIVHNGQEVEQVPLLAEGVNSGFSMGSWLVGTFSLMIILI